MLRVRRQLIALVRDALFAALLVMGKEMLAFLPNVEIVTMLIMAYTTVYRVRALVPIYVFVAVEAVIWPSVSGTLMYLYIWLVPWALVMLLPRAWQRLPAYVGIGTLFGLAFGTLCAPVHALYFGVYGKGLLTWIAVGFPWDVTHAIGNFAMAFLTPVICRVLRTLEKQHE
ncbi:MAG: hypothetical protein IJ012_07440 [Clostridia bacterium]|nr:hypothetical protein [Clostridia bacterium]